jgi:nitrite reductase/ring-hydroxylating ferredoxin subunit
MHILVCNYRVGGVLPDEDIDVFVVCAAGAISPGEAKAFSLWRLSETGEAKPFPIVIIQREPGAFFGYVNVCRHEGTWLNIGSGKFLIEDGCFLQCGRHGAKFEIDTGICVEGACLAQSLEPVALALIDGDVCVCGVALVEDDLWRGFDDLEETMDIMIH